MGTYLITGANRGIGLELARRLCADHDVIGTARDPSGAEELLSLGVRVEALDVGDVSSIEALGGRLGGVAIDVLINNAGVFVDKHAGLMELTAEELSRSFAVNAAGPVFVTRALLPRLESGGRKLVVNITSEMGSVGRAGASGAGGHFAYRASKAALNMHTALLASALRSRGVTVVGFHPGWVRTDMGGADARLTPGESVSRMLAAFERVEASDSGGFFDPDGEPLPF